MPDVQVAAKMRQPDEFPPKRAVVTVVADGAASQAVLVSEQPSLPKSMITQALAVGVPPAAADALTDNGSTCYQYRHPGQPQVQLRCAPVSAQRPWSSDRHR